MASDLPSREEIADQLRTYEQFSKNVLGEDIGEGFYEILRAYEDGRLVDKATSDDDWDRNPPLDTIGVWELPIQEPSQDNVSGVTWGLAPDEVTDDE